PRAVAIRSADGESMPLGVPDGTLPRPPAPVLVWMRGKASPRPNAPRTASRSDPVSNVRGVHEGVAPAGPVSSPSSSADRANTMQSSLGYGARGQLSPRSQRPTVLGVR